MMESLYACNEKCQLFAAQVSIENYYLQTISQAFLQLIPLVRRRHLYFFSASFAIRVVYHWNKLPIEAVLTPFFNRFKSLLEKA